MIRYTYGFPNFELFFFPSDFRTIEGVNTAEKGKWNLKWNLGRVRVTESTTKSVVDGWLETGDALCKTSQSSNHSLFEYNKSCHVCQAKLDGSIESFTDHVNHHPRELR